jgi:hypothetical protein
MSPKVEKRTAARRVIMPNGFHPVTLKLPPEVAEFVEQQASLEYESDASWIRRLIVAKMREVRG